MKKIMKTFTKISIPHTKGQLFIAITTKYKLTLQEKRLK